MKKILIVMRHGKAADSYQLMDDFQRPLEDRGRQEVAETAQLLKNANLIPDIIIASPALRTTETATIVASVLGIDASEIQFEESLYMSQVREYLNFATEAPARVILMVGHNPFVGDIASHFSSKLLIGFPTSSAAAFQFESEKIRLSDTPQSLFLHIRK